MGRKLEIGTCSVLRRYNLVDGTPTKVTTERWKAWAGGDEIDILKHIIFYVLTHDIAIPLRNLNWYSIFYRNVKGLTAEYLVLLMA